jgi:catechol 2,3-dioxygenase-like lactoylglutathione lyase family enzyme
MPPVRFRNVTRYVEDVEANVPLYEALGLTLEQQMGSHLARLQGPDGTELVLHAAADRDPGHGETTIGATATGDVEAALEHMREAGFELVRKPQEEDEGTFYVYEDLSGNPVTLVADPDSHD